MNSDRPNWRGVVAQPWLLAPALVFGVYLTSMPLSVTFEDDGLFLMAASHAGLPQPPGYPLYVLAGHLATLLPFGTIPVRLHALSALFGAATCAFIAILVLRLTGSNAIAFVSAAAFGLSRTFWSQSIIAEVYAPNACLVFLLLWLGLRAFPAPTGSGAGKSAWGWFAFVYGLALSLHWPLVLLSSPALAVLLWTQRKEIGRRWPMLPILVLTGLLPYAWMIWRSQGDVFINFYGPLQTLHDVWYFISRQGYTEVDVSATAGLIDKIRFAQFLGLETVAQFGPAGLLLAAAGFAAQWKKWPGAVGAALTLLFLGNSAALLLLVHFDYDHLTRTVFAVYPHLAYGALAVWFGLGLQLIRDSLSSLLRGAAPRNAILATLIALLLGAQLVQNGPANWRPGFAAADDYGRVLLGALPPNADLFVDGDIPTHTLGYLRYVEGVRQDLTIYNLRGLVFANRLFDPVHSDPAGRLERIAQHVDRAGNPQCTTSRPAPGLPEVDHWLFSCLAPSASAGRYRIEYSAAIADYFRRLESLRDHADGWTAYHHDMLLKRAGEMLGRAKALGRADAPFGIEDSTAITRDFHGALGYLEGLTYFPDRQPELNDMIRVINGVPRLPAGAKKVHLGRFLALRATVNEQTGDRKRAVAEFEDSVEIWPDPDNPALPDLLRLYREDGNRSGYERILRRFPDSGAARDAR